MNRIFTALLTAVAVAGFAQVASAQYMYLDANANGVHDTGDRLNGNGAATTVDLYVRTNMNRDGSTAVCNTGSEPLTINQYQVNLVAVGGVVQYSGFINQQSAVMPTGFGELNPDGIRYKNGFGGGTQLAAGTYRLCTLTITGLAGSPRIDIVDQVAGSFDFTGFGTACLGRGFDNVYRLDGPNVPPATGDIGDFVDWDGLGAAGGPNTPPVVTNPGNRTVAELVNLAFTVTATDSDIPANTITWSLTLGPPAATGATIGAGTGAFSWTPTEAQGPGTYPVTITATDNGTPVLSGSTGITITVNEVNVAPVLAPIGNKTGTVGTPVTFTATATDADLPANTLTFSLDAGAPAGATINATTGAFSYTPTVCGGTFPMTVRVTDNGNPALSDFEAISITTGGVNLPPVLAAIGNKTVNELALLAFTATATDQDAGQTLTFSLDAGAPAGATIGASTGAFSWTPTESQGPSVNPITVRVTDSGGGCPTASDFETIQVTVNEVNVAPVVTNPGNRTVAELVNLAFTVTATDSDVPANTITWSLTLGTPAATGATIGVGTGAFSWIPTEAQGPGTYPVTIVATDNGSPVLSGSAAITITVTEVNVAPVLAPIGSKTVQVGVPVTFTATATDADVPANTLTFSLDAGAPAGATINGSTGAFSYTPSATGAFPVTVRVTDNGNPALSDFEVVTFMGGCPNNTPPGLAAIGSKTVNELAPLTFTATATDPDAGQTLAFSLDAGSPSGAAIGASTGAFSWTPNEAQGPGVYPITVRVTDSGGSVECPPGSDFETIQVTVNEVNGSPVLAAIGNKTVTELTSLTFTATAIDPDLPPNVLTFSLTLGTPAATGATINASTGAFAWTPTTAQANQTYPVTVIVTDNGVPPLNDTETIGITVLHSDSPPVVTNPGNKTVNELVNLAFTVTATAPGQTITWSLTLGTPAATGATIGATTGAFSWTPTEFQGPGSYPVTITATDNGTPPLSGTAAITITVNEVNTAPVVMNPGDKTVNELANLAFTVTATDADIPANAVSWSLDAGAPPGATIDAPTGAFSWTPTEAQGPGVYPVTIRATDNGAPPLSGTAAITITVNELNGHLIADAGGPYTGSVGVAINFDGTGSSDPEGDPLTYDWTFGDGSIGTGATPSHAYSALGTFDVTLRVTDPAGLYDDDATTATVRDRGEVLAVVILKHNGTTLDARKGKSHTKLAIEQLEFPYTGILAGTLRMSTDDPNSGTVSECAAEAKAGTGTIGDMDTNGVPDYMISFAGSCVKNLFSNTPNNSTVNLIVTGEIQTATGTIPLRGVKAVTVQTGFGGAAPILASAYPNPFNPQTAISYTVKNSGPVTLRIFSIDGRLIRTLMQSAGTEAGTHEVIWNGTNDRGQPVPSGIYFVRTTQKTGESEESLVFKLAVAK